MPSSATLRSTCRNGTGFSPRPTHRPRSWTGFSDDFVDPPPWYFRTLADWIGLLIRSGLRLESLREPIHPETGKPASIILTAAR